jgi:putative nucleotidyltransferase with HDIG domain
MFSEIETFESPVFTVEDKACVERNLRDILEKISKLDLFQALEYIINEFAQSANKANFKRIFFRRNDMDINDPAEYAKGMKTFHDELEENTKHYFSLAEQLGFYVRINLEIREKDFIISINNNASILPVEKGRIEDKFFQARRFHNIQEVMSGVLDQSEGAGFGLIIVVLMLRKIGLDEKVITILSDNKETTFQIRIPLYLAGLKERETIADEIIHEIQQIPQFPQHILELQKILEDPNADFSALSHIIRKDPALITDLLKTANSAIYALPRRVTGIEDAVKLIGFKGVKNLILSYTVQNILMNQYHLKEITQIMTHSLEVAFYAHRLVKRLKLKGLFEDLYISAILHDIGKIIVYAIDPKIFGKIEKVCREKGIPQAVMENLTEGYNHSLIGAQVVRKWNFPESLVQVIQYHHLPLEASPEYETLVRIIYIANQLFYYRRDQLAHADFNQLVLKEFGIEDEEMLNNLSSGMFAELTEKKDSLKI